MRKPLAIDLFCGLGGWTDGLLSEGWDVIGFDIERHDYGTGGYPGQLVLQDILTLHGWQFKNVDLIVASPPCQEYSYMAMPWSLAKAKAKAYRDNPETQDGLNALFNACVRIQREASEAAGRYIPMVVENVKGAQPWVGRARAHFGSFYLWGDVDSVGDAIVAGRPRFGETVRASRRGAHGKANPEGVEHPQGSWFKIADSKERGANGQKVEGFNFHAHDKGEKGGSFQTAAVKVASESGRRTDVGKGARFTTRDCGQEKGFAKEWRDSPNGMPMMSSKSSARKAASAQIAKIPEPLARHIARVFRP